MPHGFFTVEQWKPPSPGAASQWVPVRHLDACHTLTDAIQSIETEGQPGFFRVVQTRRMVRAEQKNGKLHLKKLHAGKPETLARSAEAFDRDTGSGPSS